MWMLNTTTIQHTSLLWWWLNLPPCYSLVACPPYPHASFPPPSLKYFTGGYLATGNISTYLSGFSQQQFEMAHLPTDAGGHGTPHQILLHKYNIFSETRCTHRQQQTTTIITNASGYESCSRQTCITVSDDWYNAAFLWWADLAVWPVTCSMVYALRAFCIPHTPHPVRHSPWGQCSGKELAGLKSAGGRWTALLVWGPFHEQGLHLGW